MVQETKSNGNHNQATKDTNNVRNEQRLSKQLPSNLVLRSFQPSDEAACQLLESRANQFRSQKFAWLSKLQEYLVQVEMTHPRGFDARGRLFSYKHEVIVCEDVSLKNEAGKSGRVVAVVAVNIRQVLWPCKRTNKSKQINVGFVYNLRVDEDYQRCGIGRALSHELERRCQSKENNVSLLYLTVNADNHKAKALYKALGYQHASYRKPPVQLLSRQNILERKKKQQKREQKSGQVFVVRVVDPQVAAAVTSQYYEGVEMSPSNHRSWHEIFSCEYNEGTFLAIPKDQLPPPCSSLLSQGDLKTCAKTLQDAINAGEVASYGGISLWNASGLKGVQMERLLFTKETWLSPFFQWAFWGVGVVLPFSKWIQAAVWKRGRSAAVELLVSRGMVPPLWLDPSSIDKKGTWSLPWLFLQCIELLLLAKLLHYAYQVYQFFRFVTCRNSKKLSCSGYAPFAVGPRGMDCLSAAVLQSCEYAREEGYGMWICNMDEGHPGIVAGAFPESKFKTQFLQKWLVDAEKEEEEEGCNGGGEEKQKKVWRPFEPKCFLDPREK